MFLVLPATPDSTLLVPPSKREHTTKAAHNSEDLKGKKGVLLFMWLVEENTNQGVLFFGNTCQGGTHNNR